MYYKFKLMAALVVVSAFFSLRIGAQTIPNSSDVPTILSYQGQITGTGGQTVNGTHHITATLYTDHFGNNSLWQGEYDAAITNGIFNILLGSGKSKLPEITEMNRSLWVGIRVDGGEELKPLTQLSAAPYALNVPDKSITAAKLADDLLLGSIKGPQIQATPNWTRTGDAYSAASGDVLGTAGAGAGNLLMVVQGTTTMRYDATSGTPNITGGDANNSINGSIGGTIAGGGSVSTPHTITYSHFSTIGGGNGNTIDSIDFNNHNCATVAGGCGNTADGSDATVAGGGGNYAGMTGFVGGGTDNSANPTNSVSNNNGGVVTGGYFNVADNQFATVGGGEVNKVYSTNATVAGGNYNVINLSSDAGSIGGGEHNTLATSTDHGTIAGGYYNTSSGSYSAITGGSANIASGAYSFDGGGRSDTVAGDYGVNGGGQDNLLTSAATHSVIGGGEKNKDSSDHTFIGGGSGNGISPSTSGSGIGGGSSNLIQTGGSEGFIGGGENNKVNNGWSFIGAGQNNTINAGVFNHWNVIGGGFTNSVTGAFSTIGGGATNSAGAGASTIAGGNDNKVTAGGTFAAIPGGDSLIAQSYAQTVVGFKNLAQGSQIRTGAPQTSNDRLFIIGNGDETKDNTGRSNAFEVSYNGHSIVYDKNGSGIIPGGRADIIGATYNDNIINAWGDYTPFRPPYFPPLPRTVASNADFGIANMMQTATGVYVIILNTTNSANTPTALTAGAIHVQLINAPCGVFASVGRLSGSPATFTVTITKMSLVTGGQYQCDPIDEDFSVIVTGR